MKYCGIDLHSNNNVVVVSDEEERPTPCTQTKRGACAPPDLPPNRSSRDDYLAFLRIAAKPAIARSPASITIAHSESAGMVVPPPTNGAQVGTVIVSASVVTVPPNARALPVKFAKCPIVMPAASRIFPTNVGVGDSAAFAPRVVAPTGAQNTSEAQAPPAKTTIELAPVLSAPPGLKI
jgi:hypothetical protein